MTLLKRFAAVSSSLYFILLFSGCAGISGSAQTHGTNNGSGEKLSLFTTYRFKNGDYLNLNSDTEIFYSDYSEKYLEEYGEVQIYFW